MLVRALSIAMVILLAVGCEKPTHENVDKWVTTQKGPGKLKAALSNDSLDPDLSAHAAIGMLRRRNIMDADVRAGLEKMAPARRTQVVAKLVTRLGIQIYGGMGFSEDTPMESAWRDARIARIYEGTNEINRMLSVGMLIKKAMKGHVDLLGPASKVQEELMGIPSFDTPDYSELFSEEKELIGKLKKAFLMVAGGAVQKYGPDLEGHQQLLMAAADMLIEIYMAESTILRTEKLAKKQGEAKVQEQIAMAKLYLYKAVDVVTQKGKESIISFAEGDEQRMMLMGLRRFTKYTNMPNIVGLRETITTKLVAANAYCF